VADAALDLKFGTKHRVPPFVPHELDGVVMPIDEVISRYFVRLNVVDVARDACPDRQNFRGCQHRHILGYPTRGP